LTNNPGAPASLTPTAGTPQSTTVNTAFPTALAAVVKDSFGNVIPGVSVTFTPPATGATGSLPGRATLATHALRVPPAPPLSPHLLPCSSAAPAPPPAVPTPRSSDPLTNNPGAPASLTPTAGTPQSTTVNTAFPTALAAVVKDSFGNVIPGVSVTFTP